MSKILSITPTWQETLEKIRKQGYVYIKTQKENGDYWIHKESVTSHLGYMTVFLYPEFVLSQRYYGIIFALTREELDDETRNVPKRSKE